MPPRKRQAPATPEASSGRRRSLRVSSTGKTSKYFEEDSEDELVDDEAYHTPKRVKASGGRGRPAGRVAKVEDEESEDAYKEDGNNDDEQEDEEEEDPSEDDVQEAQPVKSKRGRKPKAVESEDEQDEHERPKEIFIPHKKLRELDGIDYEDGKIHKNTLLFLKDLRANNKRSWLKSNDAEYRRSLTDWSTYVEAMTEKITEFDETIPELPIKDVIFRIYRDIRFSKDPTPYKAHYSAAWSRTGRKGPYACYYVHCEPGKSFVGGGLWHPDADQLHKLRASIDERPRKWRRALMDEGFSRMFLPKAKNDEKSVIKAFAESNKESALKTKPKGFIAEHRDIELLKLRNFTIGKKVPDDIFTDKRNVDKVTEIIGAMVGFITHLNSIVMPDPGVDSDSDEDEDEDSDDDINEG